MRNHEPLARTRTPTTDPHPLPLLTPMQLLDTNTRLGLEQRKLNKAINSALPRQALGPRDSRTPYSSDHSRGVLRSGVDITQGMADAAPPSPRQLHGPTKNVTLPKQSGG